MLEFLGLNNNKSKDMKIVLPLVNWSNGIVMIGVFAVVVVALVLVMLSLMNSGKGKQS